MSVAGLSAGLGGLNLGEGVEKAPFPVTKKEAIGYVAGKQTVITSMYFAEKIMITISQDGRLSQWVCFLVDLR